MLRLCCVSLYADTHQLIEGQQMHMAPRRISGVDEGNKRDADDPVQGREVHTLLFRSYALKTQMKTELGHPGTLWWPVLQPEPAFCATTPLFWRRCQHFHLQSNSCTEEELHSRHPLIHLYTDRQSQKERDLSNIYIYKTWLFRFSLMYIFSLF